MEAAIALARRLAGPYNVYKNREDCLRVLLAMHDAHPLWWNDRLTAFLRAAEAVEPYSPSTTRSHCPIVLLEGLDGSGKTSVAHWLSLKLGAAVLSTPPGEWADIRPLYRNEDEAVARAFYSAANYMAGEQILKAASMAPFVVVDRWWTSTCAMALANGRTRATLPPDGDAIYSWPADLPCHDAGYFLHVDEATRVARIRKRAPEDAEERRLSAYGEMRATATEAYHRTHALVTVPSPTYPVAVNDILARLKSQGIMHDAVPFAAEEISAVRPF